MTSASTNMGKVPEIFHPRLRFGCANVGVSWNSKEDLESLAGALADSGVRHLDTAARYPPHSPGLSERLIGDNDFAEKGFNINTKIMIKALDGAGSMSADAISQSISQSHRSLKVTKVSTLYCHGPDKQTPIAEQAAAIDAHYKNGDFEHFGVSNFDPVMLKEWIRIADEKSYVKPSFYQGQYSLVCRGLEESIFPILREHGIHFSGFGPLAGGFLTGKLTFADSAGNILKGTRFEEREDNLMGKAARRWYDKPGMHAAIRELKTACGQEGIEMADAAIRWVVWHSALGEEDEVIFGATKTGQIEGFVKAVEDGKLPERLVDDMERISNLCKDDAKAIIQY